ncbi:hypothetical protein TTRE_0000098301 [Trichuris trichiura]|uniref:Uncharacterized protein n=1 Tax=Trichuris trichiura TaxID=36087 RepID=A0A077YY63_TRITR|nr:hypothetical protein TTRE_0000098301 [Trichuris trichiura]
MALQTFYCNLESTSASRCSITIPKIGDATLGIRLHACSTPMQLDLTIEMLHTIWLLTFVLSNSNEYRIIGFDYWPLLVDMNWSDRQVQICLESVKSGDRLCLANDTLPGWDRNHCEGIKQALRKRSPSIAMLVLLCLFISLVMVYLAFLSLRTFLQKRRGKYQPFKRIPILSKAVPYREQKPVARERYHWPAVVSASSRPAPLDSTASKEVQTSNLSLDTGCYSSSPQAIDGCHLLPAKAVRVQETSF